MTLTRPRRYTLPPAVEQRGSVMGLRPAQLAIAVALTACAVTVLAVLPSAAGLAVVAVLLLVGAPAVTMRFQGRSLDQWVPVAARMAALASTRRTLRFGVRPGAQVVAPPTLTGVTAFEASDQPSVGIIKDAAHGSYIGVLRCHGVPFVLLDDAEQERRSDSWGRILSPFAQEGSPVETVSWLERTVPEDGDALHGYVRDSATLSPEHPLYQSYLQVIGTASRAAKHHECLVCVRISARKAHRLLRRTANSDQAISGLLVRELDALAERLWHAEVDVDGPLSMPDLSALMRRAFDPRSARALAWRDRLTAPHEAPFRRAWPTATEVQWRHYRTDDAVHATFWVAGWPKADIRPDFMAPLILRPDSVHTVAVVMEPIPPSRAARAAEAAHASLLADEDLRQRAGFLATARRRREQEAVLRREAELADGHADFRFAGYVTVTAPTVEALDEAANEIEHLAFASQLEVRRLFGMQDTAFTYTLPLGRGLS